MIELKACPEAIEWASKFARPEEAWAACEKPAWLLRIAGKLALNQKDRKAIVLVAAACARAALKYVPAEEPRPLAAIVAAETWAKTLCPKNRVAAEEAAWAAEAVWATVEADWTVKAASRTAADAKIASLIKDLITITVKSKMGEIKFKFPRQLT